MSYRQRRPIAGWVRMLLIVLTLASFLHSLASLAADPAASNPAKAQRLASFQLPDQFGTNHTFAFPRSRPLLLLVGDRRGSEEIDPWIEPLKKRWKENADIAGLADVQGAPRFLRGRITEAIRKSRSKPLLLDFEGKVSETLPLKKKTANIFLIGPDGTLLVHVAGPYPSEPDSDPRLKALENAFANR